MFDYIQRHCGVWSNTSYENKVKGQRWSYDTQARHFQGLWLNRVDLSRTDDEETWFWRIMDIDGYEVCSTVANLILINGKSSEVVKPQRGLRQGDSISRYLFLICAKGLKALLTDAEHSNYIRGVWIAKGAPLITHLFFANNIHLFYIANTEEWKKSKVWWEYMQKP